MLIGEYDYDTDIAVQREESFDMGLAEGKSLGLAQGSLQAKLETARLMKQANCEIPFIAKMTGLTTDEVDALDETHS